MTFLRFCFSFSFTSNKMPLWRHSVNWIQGTRCFSHLNCITLIYTYFKIQVDHITKQILQYLHALVVACVLFTSSSCVADGFKIVPTLYSDLHELRRWCVCKNISLTGQMPVFIAITCILNSYSFSIRFNKQTTDL